MFLTVDACFERKYSFVFFTMKEPPVWEGLLKIVVIVGGLLVLAYMIIVNVRPGGGA